MIPTEIIDRIREVTDIVELIGRDIELVKNKACCPFHNEKSPSFTVNPERQTFHCFGCNASGDVFGWLTDYAKMTFKEAVQELGHRAGIPVEDRRPRKLDRSKFEFSDPDPEPASPRPRKRPRQDAGGLPTEPFDWQVCADAFDDAAAARVVEERGFSPEIVDVLHRIGKIGLHQGKIAFPVEEHGKVVRCHYKHPVKGWGYFPKGDSSPLVIGDVENAAYVPVHESQWDAIAMLDALGYHEDPREFAAIITRGATAKTDLSSFKVASLIAIPQNDPPEKKNKDGFTPAEQWLELVKSTRSPGTQFLIGKVPGEYLDLNDWTRTNPDTKEVRRLLIDEAKNPALNGVMSGHELRAFGMETHHPDCLIGTGKRFLGKGGSFLFIGPSGIGKSTLMTAMTSHWAAGVSWQGINVRRPLKILVIQAENDDADQGEMLHSAMTALEREGGLNPSEIDQALRNLFFLNESERCGLPWVEWFEQVVVETGADVAICDPLLSYIGDDISQQSVCSQFLRNWIQPVLKRTGVIIGFVHHTGKTSSDPKSRSHWTASDGAYLGIGSSELTNWARAIFTLTPASRDSKTFRLSIAKRGGRAGMTSSFGEGNAISVFLAHSETGLGWTEVEEPESAPASRGRKRKFRDEDILNYFVDDEAVISRDALSTQLVDALNVCLRTARDRITGLIDSGGLHVCDTQPRPSGGMPLTYLKRGPDPSL